jgi:high affinity sulfate transporter 1
MTALTEHPPASGTGVLARFAPGLAMLRSYRREWVRFDVVAGVSVAAVAIPTAVAYAQIAGFSPIVGLYASILPLVVYALLGTSRHLVVNPDAATCAMVAAICTPLAAGDPGTRLMLSILLALMVGVMCIAGGVFHLGFIADFLSRPILLGLLNGVIFIIFLGQIGPLLGFHMHADGVIPRIAEIARQIGDVHWPTAASSAIAIGVLIACRRIDRRIPGPLIVMVAGAIAVGAMGLGARGVESVGSVTGALPALRLPELSTRALGELCGGAFGLSLVVFSKGMLHARVFAARHRYEVDADQELIAVGASNIAAGLSQGFAVAGTDSRTALADSMGAKTQVTGLIVAVLMALTLAFLTEPLALVPKCAIAAVLAMAVVGLFDWREFRKLMRVSRGEFVLAVATALGVAGLGVLPGMGFAVTLAILRLLALSRRPHDAILGRVDGLAGFHNVEDFPDAKTIPGLAMYRFESALVFYNAPFFKQRALLAASAPGTKWLVLDASSIPAIDATGAEMVEELRTELAQRGVDLALATARHKVRNMLGRAGTLAHLGPERVHPTIKGAVRAYFQQTQDLQVTALGVSLKKFGIVPAQTAPESDAAPAAE